MLREKMKGWMLGAVVLVAISVAYVRAADVAKDDAADDQFKAMAVAALQTFDQMLQRIRAGEPSAVDEMYLWSRRVMDAESRANPGHARALLDAAKAHEKRMRDLGDAWGKLASGGIVSKTSASNYYLLEAKALVADAEHRQ
jgi:hypothetical protein